MMIDVMTRLTARDITRGTSPLASLLWSMTIKNPPIASPTSDYSIAGQRIARSGDVLHLTAGWTRAGLPTALGIGDHAPLSFQHDARGLEQLRASDQGFALAQGHTIMGNLAEQIAGPLARLPEEARTGALGRGRPLEFATRMGARLHRSYDWDRAGRAISIHDRQLGWQNFGYDDRGQVAATRRDGPDGQSILTEYEYDPARNIAAVIEAGHRQPVQTAAGRVQRRGDALARDIMDARRIYMEDCLYTPEIRQSLLEVIRLNKELYPEIFTRGLHGNR